jgi:hypothetical protein
MKKTIQSRPSIRDWTHDEYVQHLMEHVYDCEEQASALYYTLCTPGKNLLLYGPPGFAKSMILEIGITMVLGAATEEDFYKQVHMQSAAPGMPMEPFIGSFSYEEWKTTGYQHYNMEKTVFLSSVFGILEEGLSAPPKVLLALRDVLQRGFVCVDGVCYKNKLEHFFIPTNVYPAEWIKSLPKHEQIGGKALLNRFHRQVEVNWIDFTAENWVKFYRHQFNEETLLSEMLGEACQAGHQFNPRTAYQLFAEYETYGIKAIKNYDGMSPAAYEIFEKVEARAPYINEIKGYERDLSVIAEDLDKIDAGTVLPKSHLQKHMVKMMGIQNGVKSIKIPSDTKYTTRLHDVVRVLGAAQGKLLKAYNEAPERAAL